jgi:tetratricopeptide (TPR) repeat protein
MRHLVLALTLLPALALAQAPPSPPPPPMSPAVMRQKLLAQMLDALQAAPDEEAATALETRIRSLWLNAGTPAVGLLISRGARELQDHDPGDAQDDLDAALDLQPDLAAGWTLRASAQFAGGDTQGAIRDVGEALRLEPRNFDALQLLSRIAEARSDWKGAYAAWQKVMEIDPKTSGGDARLKDLRRRALGDNT